MKQNKERFLSLDVFRGLTIALMIIVNTPGTGADIYSMPNGSDLRSPIWYFLPFFLLSETR